MNIKFEKVMENDDMNMMSGEVNASTLLDFFNQLTSKSSSSLESLPIKVRESILYREENIRLGDGEKGESHCCQSMSSNTNSLANAGNFKNARS